MGRRLYERILLKQNWLEAKQLGASVETSTQYEVEVKVKASIVGESSQAS